MALEPAWLEGDGAACCGPVGAVCCCWVAAAWGVVMSAYVLWGLRWLACEALGLRGWHGVEAMGRRLCELWIMGVQTYMGTSIACRMGMYRL